MKKIFKSLKFSSIFLLVLALFIACDKDFNTIDSAVLGKDNANFNTDNLNLQILAYNKKLDSLKINDLSSNLLGVFNDPAYGLTTASIITQVTPSVFNPDFGDNTEIDSVILTIPYFSRNITDTTYVINKQDSLYGNDPIKLSVYQNNYFLRDFNPNSEFNERQNYYSIASSSTNSALDGSSAINFEDHKGALIYEDLNFTPSENAIELWTTEDGNIVKTKSAPALRDTLTRSFWKELIINKENDPVLSNANNFKAYFRGLYFKAEAVGVNGNMILLNLASNNANITIYFSKDSTVDGERLQDSFTLNFTGNRLNTFINNYTVPLTNGNKTTGDERLYLKGTEGSMAVIDLFGGGMVECQDENGEITLRTPLDCFKKTYRQLDENGNDLPQVNGNFPLKKLINEAHLVIYEDENILTGGDSDFHKYDRIYAYDIKNNAPTIDFAFFDPTEDQANPVNSKVISLGQRKTDDKGISKYKIRLTEHLNNILLKDSTNTKIGLTLSTNVNVDYNPSTGVFNTATILESEDEVTKIPSTALLTPRGTILYGNHQNVPDNRKLKLEIFFTEPNL